MPIDRRQLIMAAGLALPGATLIRPARAAPTAFPAKDITFIVPYGAGGGFDSYVRAIAPAMARHLPHKVEVLPDNIASGGGSRGIAELYRAKPDGYTIGIFNIPGMFILQQQNGAAYDLSKFTWLGSLGRDHYGLAVAWNSPLKSIADLQALSKKRPVKFTSTGPEGTAYAATQIATKLLGIRAEIITGYKGSNDYVVAAYRGDGDAVITALPLLRRMQAGQTLHILASFEAKGSVPGAEDATALGQPELGQITLDRLVGAPPHVPAAIATVLSTALTKALADPAVIAWAKTADAELSPETPAETAATVRDQGAFFKKWKGDLTAG